MYFLSISFHWEQLQYKYTFCGVIGSIMCIHFGVETTFYLMRLSKIAGLALQ